MIKKFFLLTITFLIIVITSLTLSAQNKKFMFLNEVKEGMQGYGLTVFKGNKVTKFKVEILGVLKNAKPGRSMILAKCSGEVLKLAKIQQGMSGSPVYVNGRLIGAIAYTWGYSLEPIAGIQPIKYMLDIWNRTSKPQMPYKKFKIGKRVSIYDFKLPKRNYNDIHSENSLLNGARPVPTPLIVSGFHPTIVTELKKIFGKSGFEVQVGGARRKKLRNEKSTLEPGEAVGAQIVSGDSNITAIGTVTHKQGNKVLIFGHPLIKRGAINFPMTRAYVHHIFASRRLSWKIASSGNIVGMILQDRAEGVSGIIGKQASVIPVNISVKDNDNTKNYRYKMIKDPVMFLNLYVSLVGNSLFEKTSKLHQGSIKTDVAVRFLDKKTNKKYTLNFNDFYVTTNPKVIMKKLKNLIKPLQFVIYNWFNRIKILNIDTKIETSSNFNVASIYRLKLLQGRAKPGETAKMIVTLRPFRGKLVHKLIKVKIPKNIPEDEYVVFIGSGKVESLTHQRFYKYYYQPRSINHLVEILERQNRSPMDFVVWSDIQTPGLIINRHIMSNLPSSKAYAYGAKTVYGNAYPIKHTRKIMTFPTNYLINGWGKIKIQIERD